MKSNINKFEDLHVWKEGMQLTIQFYRELENCSDFGLRDQIRRAAVSIPSNIAEGFERESNKEFIRFLYIAKSSAGELRTQLCLCKALRIIEQETCIQFNELTKKLSAMLFSLIKTRINQFS